MIDKAKAFDEALERARKMLNMILDNELLGFPDQIREIFPQLKESDDEKIRQAIIKSIKEDSSVYEQEVSKEQMLAYLEKQKEQKSISAEELLVKAGLKHYKDGNMWCIFIGDNIQEGICGFGNTIDEALYQFLMEVLEIQKKQKSVEWNKKDDKIIKTIIDVLERSSQVTTYEQRGGLMSASVGYSNKYEEEIAWLKDISLNHKKFIEAVDKLWSNDWSEEDKRMLSRCIKSVECSKQFADSEIYKAAKDAEMNWLEFLPKRKNLPPKQEWSEEDEKDIAHIIEILDDCYASGRHDLSKTNHENLVNKLKSLPMRCPKSSDNWKPSEEQIEALDKALYYVPKEIGIPIAKMYRHFNKMKKKLM